MRSAKNQNAAKSGSFAHAMTGLVPKSGNESSNQDSLTRSMPAGGVSGVSMELHAGRLLGTTNQSKQR